MQHALSTFTPTGGSPPTGPAGLLTTAEAARFLGLSASCLHQWRHYKNPKGPRFVRLGMRSIRYERRTLEAWVKSQETGR